MLKKGFAALLAVSVFTLQASLLTLAADGDFTSDNNPVTVSKAVDGTYTVTVSDPYFAGSAVTVAAIENGSEPSVLKTDPSKVLYANEAPADEEGAASFRFVPSADKSFYVAVGSSKPVSYQDGSATTPYIKASVKTYTVTVTAGQNGTVTPLGPTEVEENDTFTLTATPNPGFEIDKILVNEVDTPANNEGKVTINVTQDTKIEVSFKAAAALPPEVSLAADVAFVSEDNSEVITFGQLNQNSGSEILSYGIIYGTTLEAVTDTPDSCVKYEAKKTNTKGQYGVRFTGELTLLGNTYYTRAYVTYQDGEEIKTVYSDKIVSVNSEQEV